MKCHAAASRMSLPAALAAALVLLATSQLLRAAPPGEPALQVDNAASQSASQKLEQVLRNPPSPGHPATTRFTEREVNSYLYYDLASQYPPGLSRIKLTFSPGSISGSAEVDFDKLKAARSAGGQSAGQSLGILSYLLAGVHTLTCDGAFSAVNGVGHFKLDAVSIDGFTLPRPLVEFLISAYLKPRFPALNLDQPFRLPTPIDGVEVGPGSLQVRTRAR